MKYTVAWPDAANDELADIWIQAPDRAAVTIASSRLDHELKIDAHLKGHSLGGGRRVFHASPLLIVFEVSPDDCLVTVLKVLYRS